MDGIKSLLRVSEQILKILLEVVGELREIRQALDNLTNRLEKLENDQGNSKE